MNASQTSWMTEEHEMFMDSVERFAEEELRPNTERWRKQGFVNREL